MRDGYRLAASPSSMRWTPRPGMQVAVNWLPKHSGRPLGRPVAFLLLSGAPRRNRTSNLLIKSQLLCQLS
jgi:hypothetical protein